MRLIYQETLIPLAESAHSMRCKLRRRVALWATVLLAWSGVRAQQAVVADAALQRRPSEWAKIAADNEAAIIAQQGSDPVRYRVHKVDAKGDTTREVIETRQGGVARLVERNGKPITAAEDAAERARLQAAVASPEEFLRHHKRDAADRQYALQLVKLMPTAMTYTYAPEQPQLSPRGDRPGRQIVLDFQPDPSFHPPTMLSEMLTGMAGRIWIDAASERVLGAECRVLRPVNFGWGVVGRIFPGGTIEFQQTSVGNGHWFYSHLKENLTLRELMVRTVPIQSEQDSSDFQLLPALPDYRDAIGALLAEKIPLL